ncbi:AzlD domain-containing protein [Rhodoblastus acidophilus]|uniref:AzlD domain-containing protein n=1 Tax=Candidatus Rhodoblastus alkanivorans TaxID=2954117 RepID=A0ABS9Z9C4_9HYPH|nr:AzlD domain-containing protein [Candidatus Rhodoblastus alkanivorans]MCI4677911.1 AzlD domain-containing protein [Candidatus Rhodoblastus alkanivorans]MCI4683807.1 AzlD domain-containing protein [Candidatus Rhodoblastus alkanivorans]MDI4641125.1 AzlD domain-containing protein [Rhodoblastus acidophilus]
MTLFSGEPASAPYLALVVIGFLPSEIWRALAVLIARRIDEESEVFLFVRSVATALLVGVVAKIVFAPNPELSVAPAWVRLGAIGAGAAAFFAARRSVFAMIVAGEATLILAVWLLGK